MTQETETQPDYGRSRAGYTTGILISVWVALMVPTAMANSVWEFMDPISLAVLAIGVAGAILIIGAVFALLNAVVNTVVDTALSRIAVSGAGDSTKEDR